MTATQPLDLAPIQARLDAATPGPWSADGHEIYQGTPNDYTINSPWIGETCNIDLPDHGDANGAFLAAARQDVPALLAEVTRLRADALAHRTQVIALEGAADRAATRANELQTALQDTVAQMLTNQMERDQARAELAQYVGHEPTLREETRELSRRLDAVDALCDAAEHQATRWEHPLPVPEWVAHVRAAVNGETDAVPAPTT